MRHQVIRGCERASLTIRCTFARDSAVQSLRLPPRSFVVGSFKLSGLIELAALFFFFSPHVQWDGSARAGQLFNGGRHAAYDEMFAFVWDIR